MCRSASTRLPASPRSAPAARTFLRDHLSAWSAERVRDEAELVLTELVTNAVLHGRPPVDVTVACLGDVVEVVVADASPLPPQPRAGRTDLLRDLDATLALEAGSPGVLHDRDPRLGVGSSGPVAAGRGLQLVRALSTHWGSGEVPDGKAVWARLALPDWAPGTDCSCPGDPSAVALPSGMRVTHRA